MWHILVIAPEYGCHHVFYYQLLLLAVVRVFIYSGIQIIGRVQAVAPLLTGLANHPIRWPCFDEVLYFV
jgi:hypothetical protein